MIVLTKNLAITAKSQVAHRPHLVFQSFVFVSELDGILGDFVPQHQSLYYLFLSPYCISCYFFFKKKELY